LPLSLVLPASEVLSIRDERKQRNKRKVALEEEWADLYRRGEKYNALISAIVHNVERFYDYLLWHFERSGRNVIFYSIISGWKTLNAGAKKRRHSEEVSSLVGFKVEALIETVSGGVYGDE
jgi:hypothetical protein